MEELETSAELLRSVPLFADLEEAELERFSRVAVPRSFPAGTRVFHEGDRSDACYIVREGSFRVTREHSDGRAITLATLGPGEVFGELAMLDGDTRSASAEALSDGELLALPAVDVKGLLARHPEISVKLVAALVRRLRAANERISRQSFQTVPSRVAGVLSQLVSEARGRRGGRGDDPDEPGRSGPAGRHLARERQPLPRRSRARRRRSLRPRPRHRAGPDEAAQLHLLAVADLAVLRARMVERQLRGRGIDDERVLAAMAEVPREAFVPARLRHRAYADSALPIGDEQTISQPWIVAAICQALELGGSERVLEVGTGSGYSACVLSLLAAEVVSVERHAALSSRGRARRLARSASRTSS